MPFLVDLAPVFELKIYTRRLAKLRCLCKKHHTRFVFCHCPNLYFYFENIYNSCKMSLTASVLMHGGLVGRTFAKKMSTFVLLHSF